MIKSHNYQYPLDGWVIEKVFEIAYRDDAINRNFTYEEVIEKLKEFSNDALIVEEMKESK